MGLAGGMRVQGYVENPSIGIDPLGLSKCKQVTNSAGESVPRRLVKNQDELLKAAEEAAGGSLDNFKNIKEYWWESPDGLRRIEWNPDGHANTNEGPHVTVRDFNGIRHAVTEKVFIEGWEKYLR